MAPLGSISSFTLHHRAGYSAYVRAIYCVPSALEPQVVTETERIGGAINLGRDEIRSLKDIGIPAGAEVQFVLELVAAGSPRVIASEVWRFLPTSFRTATYKCSGTVFNPHVELDLSRPKQAEQVRSSACCALTILPSSRSMTTLIDEKTALLEHKASRSLFCCL